MYNRADSSYRAFKAGLFQISNKSNEPDDLEVVGGRKSVIGPKSNTNSPTHLHRESDGGSSPASHSGAAEMLMVLHQQADSPGSLGQKNPDFGMAHGPSQFQHASYSKLMDAEPGPVSSIGVGHMDARTLPEPYAGPSSSHQADLSPRKASTWRPSYGTHPHHFSPHSSPPHVYASFDMVDVHEPGHQGVPYQYGPPQNEIWRSFFDTYV